MTYSVHGRALTPHELATAYAETINGPANAWGGFEHPVLGSSHHIMLKLRNRVGSNECDRLINDAMTAYNSKMFPND